MAEKLGLYIHIPFCKSKCAYCDFYSLAGAQEEMDGYQQALTIHLKRLSKETAGYELDTIYFGGGTPSFYGAKRISALLRLIKWRFRLGKQVEITVECNPESVTPEEMKLLRRSGVNRISLGMQSAQDGELRDIGRPHSHGDTVSAVKAIRGAKVDNLSLDLIYGLPGQTGDNWRDNVEQAIALQPQHLSCYGLKVEEGTPLASRVEAGEVLPDDDVQAELYLWTVARLKLAGYRQYEISNFAQIGCESHHNLRYWLMRPYLGVGPGAHSDFGGRRYSYCRDLTKYMANIHDEALILEEDEKIADKERGNEYLMLRLRTAHGIQEWEYRRHYLRDFTPIENQLEQFRVQGWAEKTSEGRWRFTPKGMLVSNALIGSLLDCAQW